MANLYIENKGDLNAIITLIVVMVKSIGNITIGMLFIILAAVLIFMIVIWFLNERSKDNQHRRDMEIKSIESIDYLSIITLKKATFLNVTYAERYVLFGRRTNRSL